MAIKVAQLYDKNFFSHVGAEYVCTGFMFDAVQMESLEDQLSKEGFMPGIDVTYAEQTEAAQYEWMMPAEEAALIKGADGPGGASPGMSIGSPGTPFTGPGY